MEIIAQLLVGTPADIAVKWLIRFNLERAELPNNIRTVLGQVSFGNPTNRRR